MPEANPENQQMTKQVAQPVQQAASGAGKNVLFGLAIAGLALLGVYLFFGDQLLFYIRSNSDIFDRRPVARAEDEVLTVGYVFSPGSLEPTHFDPVTRGYLVDIYEGLVRTTRDLKIESGVAVSWGLLDSLTWEFRLRPDVIFHDGTALKAEDVVYSIERALSYEGSQLKDLLNTVESVSVYESDKIHIKTRVPDPLLLQKLAVTYIFPDGYTSFDKPMGTGSYVFSSFSDGNMRLIRNSDYWGQMSPFNHVELRAISSRRDRLSALESGDIKLLANLPPSAGCSLMEDYKDMDGCESFKSENIKIKSIPSLEVSFLVFNFNNSLFKDKDVREAVSKIFDPEVFIEIAFGFAKPADQFVSSGVFGFNPQIEDRGFDVKSAKTQIYKVIGSSFERISVTFDYPASLEPIGGYVHGQMRELGIDVELNPLSDVDLQDKVIKGQSDFYFIGWRSELGDASDFLQAMAHSRDRKSGYGLFNGANYLNKKVDQLIEASQENLEVEGRLQQMQEAMQIVTEEDVLGVPLFESETIFAFADDIEFEPRVDGYIFASEVN